MYAQLEAKILNLRMDLSYAHVFYWNCECIVADNFDSVTHKIQLVHEMTTAAT